MKAKGKFIAAACFAVLAALLLTLILTVDKAPVGAAGTEVGLANINKPVSDAIGVNMTLYDLTGALGIVAILTAAVFAGIGLWQLVKRRSFFKVDKEIIALGVLYVAVVVLYVFFEAVVVNYRPVLMPGKDLPEASFPSSHTMLVGVFMGGAAMMLGKYVKNRAVCRALQTVCVTVIAATVIGRLLSGVHWLTDIIGGALISASLLSLFAGVKDLLSKKE